MKPSLAFIVVSTSAMLSACGGGSAPGGIDKTGASYKDGFATGHELGGPKTPPEQAKGSCKSITMSSTPPKLVKQDTRTGLAGRDEGVAAVSPG